MKYYKALGLTIWKFDPKMPLLRWHNMLHVTSNDKSFTLRLVFFLSQFRSYIIGGVEKSSGSLYLKENTFLVWTEYLTTKLIAKVASGQIWSPTKPRNYQTTRAPFWQCIWLISTKDNLNKTVILLHKDMYRHLLEQQHHREPKTS